jgi:hypothetical protein
MASPSADFDIRQICPSVGRDGQIVRLIEIVGMEIGFDVPAVRTDQKDIVLLVVGDEHAAFAIEADRIADASFGQYSEQFRLRGSGRHFADGARLAEIDDVQIAPRVDGRSFDSKGVFAGGRDRPALKQRVLRGRGRHFHAGKGKPAKQPDRFVRYDNCSHPRIDRSKQRSGGR